VPVGAVYWRMQVGYERYLRVDPLGRIHRIARVDSEAGVHKLPVKGALGVDNSDFGRGELGRGGV
jgi:hypothetical protein